MPLDSRNILCPRNDRRWQIVTLLGWSLRTGWIATASGLAMTGVWACHNIKLVAENRTDCHGLRPRNDSRPTLRH